jgi:hypothetical protein
MIVPSRSLSRSLPVPGPLQEVPGERVRVPVVPEKIREQGTSRDYRMYARPFTLSTCRRCDTPTLEGATEGFDVRADPYALTQTGELAARIGNRRTFTVNIRGNKTILYPREAWNIKYSPDALVVAQHKCGQHRLPFNAERSTVFIDILLPVIQVTECPF